MSDDKKPNNWLINGHKIKDSRAGLYSREKKHLSYRVARPAATLISLLVICGTFLPATARASVLSDIIAVLTGVTLAEASTSRGTGNVQTMALLAPAMNLNPAPATGGGDVTIVDDSALVPAEGPSGTIADIEKPKNGTISTYVVQQGDTLSGIAEMFDVPVNTILWANDLSKSSKLQIGEKLTILPIPGLPYTVKKGDTLVSIAKRYGGDVAEIENYNSIDESSLVVGSGIIIPNGEPPAAPSAGTKSSSGTKIKVGNEPAHNVGPQGDASELAYYIAPLSHYIETQGIHGYNAVDLGAPVGTPIMSSATGDVIIAKQGGWNGGYGNYVVIQHANGSQTLYSHMSSVSVYDGQHVVQGQVIGYVGKTGLATGPHLHFEIRNGIRNPY